MKLSCPICASNDFVDFGGRNNAQCNQCKALERTRYLWMYLNKSNLLKPGQKTMHVAPDLAIIKQLSDILSNNYYAYDFQPEIWKNEHLKIEKFDYCSDTKKIDDNFFDVVMHLHVLEHLPCSLEYIFAETVRILKPGGSFVFALPMKEGVTIENLWLFLPKELREKQFGQRDHMRWVGKEDFPIFLENTLGGVPMVNPNDLFSNQEITRAAIDVDKISELSSDTLFHFIKPNT